MYAPIYNFKKEAVIDETFVSAPDRTGYNILRRFSRSINNAAALNLPRRIGTNIFIFRKTNHTGDGDPDRLSTTNSFLIYYPVVMIIIIIILIA